MKNPRKMAKGMIQKIIVLLAAACCFAFAMTWSGFKEPDPLRLAVGTRPGSEALVFALSESAPFPPQEFRLIEMAGATAISRALENGVVDAAVISLDEALQMNDSGHPVRIGLVLEESIGADVLMVPPRITSLDMLKGQRIGAEVRSSSHDLLLKALQHGGLTLADVELLPFTGWEVWAAMGANEVDALVLTEPDVQHIPPDQMRRLFDSKQLKQPILRVLAVREEVWDQKKAIIGKVARCYFALNPRMNVGDEGFVAYFARRSQLDANAAKRCLEHVNFPNPEQMSRWLEENEIKKVLESKALDMARAQLLSREEFVLPVWDASLIHFEQP